MTTVKCCPTGGRTPPTHAFFLVPLLYRLSKYMIILEPLFWYNIVTIVSSG
jgi:hypothetical protein